MNSQILESLLYQAESETLDFKIQQYPFSGATDQQKGELLKDILAFANAWRQTDAHILIGIEEVRAGRSKVRGIPATDHLVNHTLQQFVLSKTNRPIEFSYLPIDFEGASIGVLTIPVQVRPVYLSKAYGNLNANVVYIRRSDSTGTATPDEIARMGASAVIAKMQPVLEAEFANTDTREKLGLDLILDSRVVDIPDQRHIPLYGEPESIYAIAEFKNHNYYRQFAKYIQARSIFSPVGFAVTNKSTVVAENVCLTIEVGIDSGLLAADESSIPDQPSDSSMPVIKAAMLHRDRAIRAERFGDRYEVRVAIGTVQPGITQWTSESLYFGAKSAITTPVNIRVSANNLQAPLEIPATVRVEIDHQQLSTAEIKNAAERFK